MERTGVMKKKDIEGSGGPQRRMKADLLKSLRSFLPDEAIAWIDAASVVEPDAVAFNALLGGGGGSDGNSHFSDNFMQSLWMALPDFDVQRRNAVALKAEEDGSASKRQKNPKRETWEIKAVGDGISFNSRAALCESLFGTQGSGTKIPGLSPVLFDNTRVGGPNQTTGFEAKACSNPWDFILMLEGSVLFAGAIGRKLDDLREPSARFPFLFRSSPVGLGSSYLGESSGRELWLPLWSRAATLMEIRALFAEGRVEKHGRMAKRGTDAFVAAAQLGFDRGIGAFQRVGFFKGRIGGDNYFTAVDQGRIKPRRNEKVDLLREADDWLTKLASTPWFLSSLRSGPLNGLWPRALSGHRVKKSESIRCVASVLAGWNWPTMVHMNSAWLPPSQAFVRRWARSRSGFVSILSRWKWARRKIAPG
jgi:CRISPR-associated protein Csx17